jgi:hypothetical protein
MRPDPEEFLSGLVDQEDAMVPVEEDDRGGQSFKRQPHNTSAALTAGDRSVHRGPPWSLFDPAGRISSQGSFPGGIR